VLTSLQALLRLATLRRLGVFICALATLLTATSTASALEPAQTKTRVWRFDFAEHNSVGLFRAASSGKHQGNRLAGAEEASGSLLAARAGAGAGKTVLGKFPDYVNLAESIGARRFSIPTSVWNKMSPAQQWGANQRFLDRAIARGDDIVLSNPVKSIGEATGWFGRELQYLAHHGYRLADDGARMIR
jgi:hypothetical protein